MRDEDFLFPCTYSLLPLSLGCRAIPSIHPGCSGFGLKILDGRLIAPFSMSWHFLDAEEVGNFPILVLAPRLTPIFDFFITVFDLSKPTFDTFAGCSAF